jgi:hypothetical protein
MHLSTEVVTPERARQWLTVDNHRNRKIKDGRVSYLADEIASGRWQLTHNGIAFDLKGNLLDGQHRLAAIAKAGVPVEIVIARNVAAESYVAMDRGAVRSLADVLRSDQRVVSVASAIVRQVQLSSYNSSIAPGDVQLVTDALETEIAAANSVRLSRPLARVQIRAALALRLAQSGAAWVDLLMEQWRALNQTDTAKIDPSSAALMRRLLSDRTVTQTDVIRGRVMCLAWQAFDPARRDLQQLHVDAAAQRDMTNEARKILLARHPTVSSLGSRLERALASISAR